MLARRHAAAYLPTLLAVLLACSPPDVRIGMGEGDGVKLSYRIIGTGKPLVVIHDGPGYEKSIMFGGFDALRSDMKIIYYDQRGCGRSEPLAANTRLSILDNVSDLENLRRYFHFRKMSLAAHGWGAVIALEYARAYPKRVDSIILVTPISPFAPDKELMTMVESLPRAARDKIVGALDAENVSVLEKQEVMMREILPELFYKREAAEDLRLEGLKYASDVRLRLGAELKTLDLFSMLGSITQPTLVIAGRHDISIPVRDQMAYADGIKHASAVVFNESGHFPFLEEHAFFVNLVREFLHNRSVPALAGTWHMP